MKTIKIPYKYNLNREEKYLTLIDFNEGIKLCRKLGFNPNKIILGKQEIKQFKNFTYSGGGEDCITDMFNCIGIEIVFGNKRTELTFSCNSLWGKSPIPNK